jgi:folate-binding protein YgfZ
MATPVLPSASDEYRATREGAALFPELGREVLRVTGGERVSFLHGMVTCDVEGLAAGAVAVAALLTPKGGLVCDARVWRRADDVLLEVGQGHGERVREHLSRYLISEDAELSNASAEFASLSVVGPLAKAAVDVVLEKQGVQLSVAASLLPGRPGADLLVPRALAGQVIEQLLGVGCTLAGAETFEVARVESGLPRHGVDMDEETLVLEAGLERAVSYTKGCYIGQEVVARATYRGQVQKKLTGLLLGDEAAQTGAPVFRAEKKVGQLGSVVRSPSLGQTIALALIHRDSLAPGTKLDLEGRAGVVTVQALPFP